MSSPVRPGDVLADKYRVERVLGVGGMGVVVAAKHLQLDQLVALKFMLPEVLKNANHVARFLREAKAVVRLKGEHVARVLDVGTLDNHAPYIVMEFLEGEDLAGTLERCKTLSIEDAARHVIQACEAMAEAHAQGIIHRDLKPQNLFLTKRPDGVPIVKVLDFGISKTNLVEAEGFEATHTSAMMGSPAYMSPEQIKSSKDVDPRSDIWALGVILYHLVSGQQPFTANTVVELCVKVLHTEAAPLAGVPASFAAVVARCMAKDPDQRYANVADLVADLAPFAPRGGQDSLERVARLLQVPPRRSGELEVPRDPAASSSRAKGVATTLSGSAGVTTASTTPTAWRWVVPAAILGCAVVLGAVIVASRIPASSPMSATSPPTSDAASVVGVTHDGAPDAVVATPADAAAVTTADAAEVAAPADAALAVKRDRVQPAAPGTVPKKVEQPTPPVTIPSTTPAITEPPKRDPYGRRN